MEFNAFLCFFATIYSVRMKREVNVVREAAFGSDVRFSREYEHITASEANNITTL